VLWRRNLPVTSNTGPVRLSGRRLQNRAGVLHGAGEDSEQLSQLFCFRVPELTRSADIQLNKRVSLRRRVERIGSHQPDNFPASGPSMAKPPGVIRRLAALFCALKSGHHVDARSHNLAFGAPLQRSNHHQSRRAHVFCRPGRRPRLLRSRCDKRRSRHSFIQAQHYALRVRRFIRPFSDYASLPAEVAGWRFRWRHV
jgi:hypothetical protein